MTEVRTKRAYESPARSDGPRILVDRIWPRGVAKEDADLEAWLKGLSPSSELRKWFGHDPEKWDEFLDRYREELRQAPSDDLDTLRELLDRHDRITLVFAARDTRYNNAEALRWFIHDGEL